jgi:hypothetical protein
MENSDVKAVEEFRGKYQALKAEIGKAVIGQDQVVEKVLIAILSRGHGLLVGVPGLAKTLLVNTVGNVLGLTFNRIQFTPDLMPSDIIGFRSIGPRAAIPLREGAGVRQCGIGGRDQPYPAQNASGLVGGHAGKGRHGGRPYMETAGTLLRAGHAEPH